MIRTFKAEQFIPFPLEKVFMFFSEPRNLPRIMPASLAVRIERESLVLPPGSSPQAPRFAVTGSEFTASFNLLPWIPWRTQWTARILEWEMNQYFCDTHVSGSLFKHWRHCHRFRSSTQGEAVGTTILDEIEFETGFGPVGNTVAAMQLRHTFNYRRDAIEKLLARGEI